MRSFRGDELVAHTLARRARGVDRPGSERERRADAVRLAGVSETLHAGARYRQVASELHDSRQVPGTVTVLHFDEVFDDLPELTTCRRPGAPWVSSCARTPTRDEVLRITTLALELLAGR